MKTNYQLPITELTQAGTFFANLGLECPWVGPDAWCYLEGECVYGDLLAEYDADKRHTENRAVRCPPAVAAAVVWFADVLDQFVNSQAMKSDNPNPFYQTGIQVDNGRIWAMVHRGWENMPDGSIRKKRYLYEDYADMLEAAVALILAVYKAMGGK